MKDGNNFDALLAELDQLDTEHEQMSKAYDGDDDRNIQAAAGEEGAGDELPGEGEGEGEGAGDEGAGGEEPGGEAEGEGEDEDEEGFSKSFELELEDGTKVEAYDGTELVKSLQARVEQAEKSAGARDKALNKAVDLVKKQGGLLKSMSSKIDELQNQGRGRKAVVTMHDNKDGSGDLKKSQGMDGSEFMAKALDAQKAGRITGMDVSRCESYLHRGLDIPENIKARVLSD